jgi:hypothetical protein
VQDGERAIGTHQQQQVEQASFRVIPLQDATRSLAAVQIYIYACVRLLSIRTSMPET